MTGKELQRLVWESEIPIAELVKQSGIKEPTFYSLYRKKEIDDYYMQKLYKTRLKSVLEKFNYNKRTNLSVDVVEGENFSNVTTPNENTPSNLFLVPLKAYGGFLTGYSNKVYMDSLIKIHFPWIQGECYAFEVEGYSMFRTHKLDGEILKYGYEPGSYVITTAIENLDWLRKGKDYVFVTIDGIIIKRFIKIDDGKIHLDSINKEFSTKPIPLKSIKKVFYIEDTVKNKPQ